MLDGRAHLAVEFDVLCKGGVDLCEGAAESAAGDVDQILKGVHVIVLHEVLPLLELREYTQTYRNRPPSAPTQETKARGYRQRQLTFYRVQKHEQTERGVKQAPSQQIFDTLTW